MQIGRIELHFLHPADHLGRATTVVLAIAMGTVHLVVVFSCKAIVGGDESRMAWPKFSRIVMT